ncbi:MAG: 50S ribosomal protein L11 methyltransferase [Nitrospirota bacterium]
MYLWRKTAGLNWVETHEDLLQAHAHGRLVIVQKPGRQRLTLEITCRSKRDSNVLLKEFGGQVQALPRNWLKRFARGDSKPIKIGNRLMISNVGGTSVSRRSQYKGRSHIIIPASLAFGTGEHATTAMSLRLLEQLTRNWNRGWSLVDLGTGSGILALAARRLGAGRVLGIDNDPTAISIAKFNARLNKIRGTRFQLADVHGWSSTQETNIITANLHCDLLIEILPKLRFANWVILSGILRNQKDELRAVLQRNRFDIIVMKRRGKWVAILARRTGCSVRCPQRTTQRRRSDPLRPSGLYSIPEEILRHSVRTRPRSANFCGGGRQPLQ